MTNSDQSRNLCLNNVNKQSPVLGSVVGSVVVCLAGRWLCCLFDWSGVLLARLVLVASSWLRGKF